MEWVMKKLLYVSIKPDSSVTGGTLGRKNNYLAIKDAAEFFYEYFISLKSSKIAKIISSLLGFKAGLSYKHIKIITKFIIKEKIEVVFLDSSLYGKLAKNIAKKTNAKVIAFFHNCEYEIYKQSLKQNILAKFLLQSVFINEYFSMKFSNKCIFLTERDYSNCKTIYRINCKTFFTPISLKNNYFNNREISFNKPRNLLFVGSYFYPNIHGLIWFINNVLPYIDYKLTIVGKGFENDDFTKQLSDKTNVIIKGFVESLDSEYEFADIVVQPVFEGSGMKTKTAESFMYGKPLVSTSEGLVGYLDGLKYVYKCDTEEEFVNTLNALSVSELPSYCENIRKVFEENYSLEARTSNYRKLLKEMENE